MATYIVEFYYKQECIEKREYDHVPFYPSNGDLVHIEFTNPSYHEDYGPYWIVKERRFIYFPIGTKNLKMTLMLNIEPDKHKGAFKSGL